MKLSAISPKAVEWAVRNTVSHIAFRTSGHKCTCGDCGHKFDTAERSLTIGEKASRYAVPIADTACR